MPFAIAILCRCALSLCTDSLNVDTCHSTLAKSNMALNTRRNGSQWSGHHSKPPSRRASDEKEESWTIVPTREGNTKHHIWLYVYVYSLIFTNDKKISTCKLISIGKFYRIPFAMNNNNNNDNNSIGGVHHFSYYQSSHLMDTCSCVCII